MLSKHESFRVDRIQFRTSQAVFSNQSFVFSSLRDPIQPILETKQKELNIIPFRIKHPKFGFTFKNLKILDKTNLLEKYTYKKIMSILDRGKKIKLANKDWELIKMNPSQIDVLKELDILPKDPVKPKRKPGRPPKSSVI